MKQRNPFAVLFLSIITLGIYDIYWLVKTKTILNQKTKIHTPTIWLLFLPIIVFIALIIVATVVAHPSTTSNTLNYGQPVHTSTVSGGTAAAILIVDLVAFLFIVPITFYWFFKFSKAINEYTNEELSTGVTFLLLWLLHFIGLIIVQDKFNDMIVAGRDGNSFQPPTTNETILAPAMPYSQTPMSPTPNQQPPTVQASSGQEAQSNANPEPYETTPPSDSMPAEQSNTTDADVPASNNDH